MFFEHLASSLTFNIYYDYQTSKTSWQCFSLRQVRCFTQTLIYYLKLFLLSVGKASQRKCFFHDFLSPYFIQDGVGMQNELDISHSQRELSK